MKYYAVIDTNVLVSGLLKQGSLPWEIINLCMENTIVPLLNDEIIEEYIEVCKRNKFGFDPNYVDSIIKLLVEKSILLERISADETLTDEGDVVFYEIVLSARKAEDAYLVTGNLKHFPKRKYIVTPKEMIEIIYKNFNSKN